MTLHSVEFNLLRVCVHAGKLSDGSMRRAGLFFPHYGPSVLRLPTIRVRFQDLCPGAFSRQYPTREASLLVELRD